MRKNQLKRGPGAIDIKRPASQMQVTPSEETFCTIASRKQKIDLSSTSTMEADKVFAGMRSRIATSLLILPILLLDATSALSQVLACRPSLSTKAVQEVRPASPQPLPWTWRATIAADANFCATRSGNFEIDFIRLKENSSDLQFTQTFRWTENPFDIAVELSPDEAILEFRIGFIAPCVCREVGELSIEPRVK